MMLSGLYNSTLSVLAVGWSKDAIAGAVASRTASYTNVACRISPVSAEEREIAGREGVQITHTVFCDCDTPIQQKDALEVGGAVYEVRSVIVRQNSTMDHHQEIKVDRVSA
jgi:SPP1 family predicted phage head-tail adaptor